MGSQEIVAAEDRAVGTKAEELAGMLSKVADDEPLFILRARDMYAPFIVEKWVGLAAAGAQTPDELKAVEPKLHAAVDLAEKMREWQRLNGKRKPD